MEIAKFPSGGERRPDAPEAVVAKGLNVRFDLVSLQANVGARADSANLQVSGGLT